MMCARAEAAPVFADVGVDEQLGARVPLQVRFTDESGVAKTFGDYVRGDIPVLLTFNYSSCPLLCSVQLEGLVDALRELEWTAGDEFRIVTIGLDPAETPARAARTKERYLARYDRPRAADGWQFAVGSRRSVRALADAVGFRYAYDPATDQYLHPATVVVLSPDGVVVRYLNGVAYEPRTLRLTLAEASAGEIGSVSDRIALLCYRFDPNTGRYTFAAFRLLRYGALAGLAALVFVLVVLWRRERRRSPRAS